MEGRVVRIGEPTRPGLWIFITLIISVITISGILVYRKLHGRSKATSAESMRMSELRCGETCYYNRDDNSVIKDEHKCRRVSSDRTSLPPTDE